MKVFKCLLLIPLLPAIFILFLTDSVSEPAGKNLNKLIQFILE